MMDDATTATTTTTTTTKNGVNEEDNGFHIHFRDAIERENNRCVT